MNDEVPLDRRQFLALGTIGIAASAGCTSTRGDSDDGPSGGNVEVGYGGAPVETDIQKNPDGSDDGSDDIDDRSTSPNLGGLIGGSGGDAGPDVEYVYACEDYGSVGYGVQEYGGAAVVPEEEVDSYVPECEREDDATNSTAPNETTAQ